MKDIRIVPIEHGESGNPQDFGAHKAAEALTFHRTLKEYAPTPLVSLSNLASALGVKDFLVKDESRRFGLNAFKGLGGSFAMHSVSKDKTGPMTFVTATDGNHGRGVAWAASRMGCGAHVLMPRGSARERIENIRKLGAHAEITDMSYDDAVRHAALLAEQNGWVLLQDTAWEGYEEIPALIMQGYTTMGAEIMEQLQGKTPTHVFLQAGVGAMAAAMTGFFADVFKENKPKIIIVEPEGADCIFRTAEANDGKLRFCGEDMSTIMAGLCCGEPCTIAWEVLKKYADFALCCPDYIAADGMRMYGNPLGDDERIISGESGAVTGGIAAEIMTNPELADVRDMLELNSQSTILCISTEGDTDRENYRNIVWRGKYPAP